MELFAADGHDAGGCERVTGKSGMRPKRPILTNVYNARPQWLADAHSALDVTVAAAYGWPADISDEGALNELLELNLADPR